MSSEDVEKAVSALTCAFNDPMVTSSTLTASIQALILAHLAPQPAPGRREEGDSVLQILREGDPEHDADCFSRKSYGEQGSGPFECDCWISQIRAALSRELAAAREEGCRVGQEDYKMRVMQMAYSPLGKDWRAAHPGAVVIQADTRPYAAIAGESEGAG